MESMPPLPQSYRARAPAVEGDGRDDQSAKQELHPIGIDLSEHQPILDERDHEHCKDGPDDRDIPASKRRTADDRGGEGEQQPALPISGCAEPSCATARTAPIAARSPERQCARTMALPGEIPESRPHPGLCPAPHKETDDLHVD